ncbi:hypothetical protein D3C71_2197410 [compost metagenome]
MFVADTLNRDIAADIAFRHRANGVAGIVPLGIDRGQIRQDRFCESEPRIVDVGDEKLCGAGCSCR